MSSGVMNVSLPVEATYRGFYGKDIKIERLKVRNSTVVSNTWSVTIDGRLSSSGSICVVEWGLDWSGDEEVMVPKSIVTQFIGGNKTTHKSWNDAIQFICRYA